MEQVLGLKSTVCDQRCSVTQSIYIILYIRYMPNIAKLPKVMLQTSQAPSDAKARPGTSEAQASAASSARSAWHTMRRCARSRGEAKRSAAPVATATKTRSSSSPDLPESGRSFLSELIEGKVMMRVCPETSWTCRATALECSCS